MDAHILTLIILFGLTTSVLAEEAYFGFRGIPLDTTLQNVSLMAQGRFERVLPPTFDEGIDLGLIMAGDDEGLRKQSCSITAASDKRVNCLVTRYSARLVQNEWLVKYIGVEQSFNPSVTVSDLMGKILSVYGQPTRSYPQRLLDMGEYAIREQNFIWGGTRIPATFSQSWIPFNDAEQIGGKHLTLRIILSGDGEKIAGYSLRISDGDFLTRKAQEQARLRALKKKEAERKNASSIAF